MSMSITPVRRCHVYIGGSERQRYDIECPDCGKLLFEVVQHATGSISKQCNRCKERDGTGRMWIFLFYNDISAYVEAVKTETKTVNLTKGG